MEVEVTERMLSLPKEIPLRRSHDSFDLEPWDNIHDHEYIAQPKARSSKSLRERPSGTLIKDTEKANEAPSSIDHRPFYTESLQQLRTELDLKYRLENIDCISYGVAVDLNCLDGKSPDPDNKLALSLLADRNKVLQEFGGPQEFTFYPLAFHPAFGNFSSPKPPSFLADNILNILKENMSLQNDCADVLSCSYFQAYSNINYSICRGLGDLLATKSIATAAFTLPESQANESPRITARRQRLLRCVRGQLTSEGPGSSKPFARERQCVETAIEEEEFPFRLEQVLTVQVSRLSSKRRSFWTILNPILQLIRFYFKESQHSTGLLRCFRPSVFPGVLASFARIFELAADQMLRRFEKGGSKG
ncbi:hypothetical protein H2199_009230, partial [Coniosporium tulheliwenetii]